MKLVNDELLCYTAKMFVEAKGTDEFEVMEIMLLNMLSNRQTQRNIDMLRKVQAL